jgi:glycosyltransferase involved in cell wall biosynthesis
LARVIREFGADVVISNAADTLKYCVFSKVLFSWNGKIVFRNASTMSAYIRQPLVRYFNAMLLSRVNLVLSVSQHSANDIERLFPGMHTKTKVVYNGIDLKKFEKERQVNRRGEVNVLHIGGFTFEKNHAGLVRIFSQFIHKYPGARLHLVGDGPLRPRIQLLVHEQDLSDAVVFHGWVSQVEELLACADMMVLPSLLEGLPTVILEAFAARVPVIANNVGGVSELVKPGETGFLVEPNDEGGFVAAMKDVLELPCNRMLDQAFLLVNRYFDSTSCATQFVALLS